MPSSIVLVPPVIVLILSLRTKKILESLCAGILAAALIATNYSLMSSIKLIAGKLWKLTDLHDLVTLTGNFENLFLFGFLLLLGIFISLISHGGGTQAYSEFINTKIKSRTSVETSSLLLSFFCIIDDYFSILTVGAAMRPIAKTFSIPYVKLAFLINTMGPSLCVLSPITSWTAMLLAQLSHAGVSTCSSNSPLIICDPFTIYMNIIPYIFYSFIIVCSTWIIVRKQLSFGPMAHHEQIAQTTGNLHGGKDPINHLEEYDVTTQKNSLIDFLLPIFLLIVGVCFNVLYTGKFFHGSDLAHVISQANMYYSLCIGTFYALTLTLLWYTWSGKITRSKIKKIILSGCILMAQSIVMLLLANMFSDFIKNDLHTGDYVGGLLSDIISLPYVPCIFFIISLILSAATGSSWGAIAIMVPLALPILIKLEHVQTPVDISYLQILFPALGAILSGSVAGTHVSPLADNMIMSSLSTGSHHLDHVKTQTWYVIPAIIASAISFLVVGLLSEWHQGLALFASLFLGIALTIGLLVLFYFFDRNKIKTTIISEPGTDQQVI